MIKIYGPVRSSAGRCYTMLEECGLKYEVMPVDFKTKEHKSENYMRLNPNGKVPVLSDGEFTIWESAAINMYLAEKYKPELMGKTPEEKGKVYQWSIWSMVDFQPPMIDVLIQMMFVPEDKRDMNIVEKAKAKLPGLLKVVDQSLEGRKFLAADFYTAADLNVASVANLAYPLQIDLSGYKNLTAWLEEIKSRPAWKKVAEMH